MGSAPRAVDAPLRLGVNCLALSPGRSGGIAIYVGELLRRLEPEGVEVVAFGNAENHEWLQGLGLRAQPRRLPCPTRPQVLRVLWEQVVLPGACARSGVDVLLSPTYTLPLGARCPCVVTVCDMLYARHPDHVGWSKRWYWRVMVPASVNKARRVLTISEHSKRDLVRFLGLAEERVVVSPLAGQTLPVAPPNPSSALGHLAGRRMVLSVGSLGPHKNGESVVRAFAMAFSAGEGADVALVLPGRDYGSREPLRRLGRSLGIESRLAFPGPVASADLSWLYARADAFITLSECEGFGMTVVEAMTAGCAVVSSTAGALPEVVGDGGVLVGPHEPEAAARALGRILADPGFRAELSRLARARSARFDWRRTAERTVSAVRACAVGP